MRIRIALWMLLMPGVQISGEIDEALDHALAEGWHELEIRAECRTEDGFRSVVTLGNGVGIWNDEQQYRLTQDQVRAHLVALEESGFADMRESYGGKRDPAGPDRQPPRVSCRVSIALDGARKEVVQFVGGRQSEELKALAESLFDIHQGPARSGVAADDLNDGLRKIARGELASEVLHLLVHRKPELGAPPHDGDDWILRIDGYQASTGGPDTVIVLELERAALIDVSRSLRGVAKLPPNLYAEVYIDLVVEVLNREKHVQARPFAGMTAATHGAQQEQFDDIFRRLHELRERVLREGSPRRY